MEKLLSAAFLLMMSTWAFAATSESMANAPVEQVDTIYVVIFGVIFVGLIVFFFAYWWWSSRNKKPEEQ